MKRLLVVLLLAGAALFGATETELQRAYAKEFAFLKEQRMLPRSPQQRKRSARFRTMCWSKRRSPTA
ncbi:MAG: hypothetical protein P8Y51_09860 [Campylobacterales bacterium]